MSLSTGWFSSMFDLGRSHETRRLFVARHAKYGYYEPIHYVLEFPSVLQRHPIPSLVVKVSIRVRVYIQLEVTHSLSLHATLPNGGQH
jgi:hypothetical protein